MEYVNTMRQSTVLLHREFAIGDTDPRLFGSFIEHLGRCVYGGIFEPGHPSADAKGFRQDVMALIQELAPAIVRYPGGNFVSGYRWEDGVGPLDERPRRLDYAWMSTESNSFGTNEFIDWCRQANIEPMLAVNLGTRGPEEAGRFIEYCNHPGGTELSELRRAHGWPEPHDIQFWCLGNEMDGPWQIGAKTADEYGRIATETAKVMRWVDPRIELAACGSSGRNMSTFGAWEDTVLEHSFDEVEWISLHTYLNDYAGDTPAFLASGDAVDYFIEEVVAIADAVAARRRSSKRIKLSFDEWNVWYRTRRSRKERVKPGWPEAPAILEEIYTMKDALAFGGMLISLLNHADRVRCACLAQLVNVIAPIMTEAGGSAWRQTIFWPFAQASNFGRGQVLRAKVSSDTYAAIYQDPRGAIEHPIDLPAVPFLKFAAIDTGDGVTVFALNRDLEQPMRLDVAIQGFGSMQLVEALSLHDGDLEAVNSSEHPDRVQPLVLNDVKISGEQLQATLPPASWSMIRLA
jgi:alpha-N-arabinofuranosidase